jgi:biotin carboxyl carrier protein
MKTLFSILAPCDGVVRWISGLGEFVGEGDKIAEIES